MKYSLRSLMIVTVVLPPLISVSVWIFGPVYIGVCFAFVFCFCIQWYMLTRVLFQ